MAYFGSSRDRYIDTNGDGIPDAVVTNRYNRTYVDVNGDGVADAAVYTFPRAPFRAPIASPYYAAPAYYPSVAPTRSYYSAAPTTTYTDYNGDGVADEVSVDYDN